MMKKILSLCCGAGGMDFGFQLAGLKAKHLGVDIWPTALGTFGDNVENSETIWASIDKKDSLFTTFTPFFDISTVGHVDILLMAPPCPCFSGANINGDRNKDPRLVNSCLEILDNLKPKWWVMEESPFAQHLVKEPRFLSANDFGLYQKRRRLIAGNYPEVLPSRHCKKIHPAIRAQEVKAFNKNLKHSKKAQSCCQWFGRRLESWELAVLMGFPIEYHFHGNYVERCMQIGNAVCPPVAKAIASSILNFERNE